MNWLIFALFAFAALVLEIGLQPLLALPEATSGISPSFLLVLASFVAMLAPPSTARWSALILGLLADLQGGPVGPIPGPSALGFVVGAYAILQTRTLVFRESLVTLAVLTFVAGVFVHLVVVAIFQVRNLPISPAEAIPDWSYANQLYRRFLELLYTAAAALPAGWLLFKTVPVWGFPHKGRNERAF